MSTRGWRGALGRVALLAAGSITAALLAEAFLRLSDPIGLRVRGDQVFLPRSVRFEFEQVRLRGIPARVVHTKNHLGFRGPDPPADFADRLTVFAVGGSTTECFFLPDGQDWPALVASRLERDLPRLWLDNAGLDGHSTFGHQRLLAQHILPLRPRVVLLLVGANDVGRRDLSAMEAESERARDRRFRLERLAASSYLLASLVSVRRSWNARRMGLAHQDVDLTSLPISPTPPNDLVRAVAAESDLRDAFRHRLLALVSACGAAGTEVVLLTQPSLLGRGVDPATGVNLEDVMIGTTTGAVQWSVLESFNDVTRTVAHEQGRLLIDLAAKLPKDSRYFYDSLHFTAAGSDAVAALVAHELGPWLRRQALTPR